jgi:hypothetical protein
MDKWNCVLVFLFCLSLDDSQGSDVERFVVTTHYSVCLRRLNAGSIDEHRLSISSSLGQGDLVLFIHIHSHNCY